MQTLLSLERRCTYSSLRLTSESTSFTFPCASIHSPFTISEKRPTPAHHSHQHCHTRVRAINCEEKRFFSGFFNNTLETWHKYGAGLTIFEHYLNMMQIFTYDANDRRLAWKRINDANIECTTIRPVVLSGSSSSLLARQDQATCNAYSSLCPQARQAVEIIPLEEEQQETAGRRRP